MNDCPKYLKEYSEIWKTDHKKAKLEWFKNAKYGMFIHYGLYSMLHQQGVGSVLSEYSIG